MTEEEKETIKSKCEQCRINFNVWLNGLDTDVEKIEEMKIHIENYCPACAHFQKINNK